MASAPTVPGVLRLAPKARVGSASIGENKIMGENGTVVADGMNVDQVDGHEEVGELEEDLESVADEPPQLCNP